MEMIDLTGRMVGVTLTDTDLKSFFGLDPEFPLRRGGIYQAFGKVMGHAPVGFWMEVRWIGKPKPRGGKFLVDREEDGADAYLMQWQWVITMTLHQKDPDEAWLRDQLDGLGDDDQPSAGGARP